MYQVGDIIQYGIVGACRITDISVDGAPGCEGKPVYVIRPLYCEGTIYAPVESGKVFMRPIVSRQEAERIIGTIPEIRPKYCEMQTIGQLVEYYEGCIRTHECADLVQLTMSIHSKKKAAEQAKRKFGSVDEKYMRRAEDLLYGELAAALGMARDEVRHDFERRVSALSGA